MSHEYRRNFLVVIAFVSIVSTLTALAAFAEDRAYLVKDINTGPDRSASYPTDFMNVNGRTFFSAITPEHGRELWITDGSEAGTHLVSDLEPGIAGSFPKPLVAFADSILLSAPIGGSSQLNLLLSDGSAAGTSVLTDASPSQIV